MRRVALLSAVLVVAGGVTAAIFVATRETGTPAERLARQACGHVASFTRVVERDGSSTDAIRKLELAELSAKNAAALEVRWISLQSGVQTLQLAVSKDNPQAAENGLRVVQERCRLVR